MLDRKRLLEPARKLRRLIGRIDRRSTPGRIHALRTGTRQLEAIWTALALEDEGISGSLPRRLARIRKRAGKIRDMDVLAGYASTLHAETDEECGLILVEHLGARRHRHAKKMEKELRKAGAGVRSDLERTRKRMSRLLRDEADSCAKGLAESVALSAVRLAVGLAAPTTLDRATLHEYRLRVKELRNVLRLSEDPDSRALVEELGLVKDAIGEWHDWQELVAIGGKTLRHEPQCALANELREVADRKLDEAIRRTEEFRRRCFRDADRGRNDSAPVRTPSDEVWKAIAALAATPGQPGR